MLLKRGKEKNLSRAVKYCSCCSKDKTKPVKLFNMPLLKLASVFMLHGRIKALLVNSMTSLCVLVVIGALKLSWKFMTLKDIKTGGFFS